MQNVARAEYAYYGPSDDHGGEEDLASVTTQEWNGSQWSNTGTTLYRYWKEFPVGGSSSSSSSSGGGVLPGRAIPATAWYSRSRPWD
ncbi:MAG TPA: hypothetical protein VML55_08545 [Planctomycetaceae bacterium]|nr:hypothetical protein [Planctomycetaceae bacterium]